MPVRRSRNGAEITMRTGRIALWATYPRMNMRIVLWKLEQSWFLRLIKKTYKNVKLTQEMDQRWGQVQYQHVYLLRWYNNRGLVTIHICCVNIR